MNAPNELCDSCQFPRFVVKDCALIAIGTSRRASTLNELRDQIADASHDCLYFHFWANLLLPRFEEREYNNDFASWVQRSLHDARLAEQLALIDPTILSDVEELRVLLLDYIDSRLAESEYLQIAKATRQFEFIQSQIVVYNTAITVQHPEEFAVLIPDLSISSIFYHFIDARRRTEGKIDDFSRWLNQFGANYQRLIERLSYIDPYFSTLHELRQEIAFEFKHFIAGNQR